MPDKMKAGNYIAAYIGPETDDYELKSSTEKLVKGRYEISIKVLRYAGIVGYGVAWRIDQDIYPVYETQSQFDDNWIIISDNPDGVYLFKHGKQ